MSVIGLYDYQIDAVNNMKNGCILAGGVGSGKSRTALAYFYKLYGGDLESDEYVTMDDVDIPDLYIITTARKRDTKEWEGDMCPFLLSTDPTINLYSNKVVVDSWNNIQKYKDITNAFFIFDEQRVIGKGQWVKSFLKIAKNNKWILLSATPGDTWSDYIPVFIANGFYRNRTEFNDKHVIFSRFSSFPKIDKYINTGILIKHRNDILVNMDFDRKTKSHHIVVHTYYNKANYKTVYKDRWNIFTDEPIMNASELCFALRRIVNSDFSKLTELGKIVEEKKKVIVFYNFNYELDAIINFFNELRITTAQWNGHIHQPIPSGEKWVYLVQYNSGAEGWNCTLTDTIVFFSDNYSYKIMEQSAGRIDRLNTPFTDLYYYHFRTASTIDMMIMKTLKEKKNFSEGKFAGSIFKE